MNQEIVNAVLQTYEELGGIKYLEANPELMERILFKIVKQHAPKPDIVIDLRKQIPWLDWDNRLEYASSTKPKDLSAITNSAPPAEVKALPWKEGISDVGLAGTLRDADKQ